MSSITADFEQRDELPIFLALLLHVAFAGLIYWYVTASPATPKPIRITDLPLSIGQMLAQQPTEDPSATKKIAEAAKSAPTEATTAQSQKAQASPLAERSARVPNAAASTAIAQSDAVAAKPTEQSLPQERPNAAMAKTAVATAQPRTASQPSQKIAGAAPPALRLVAPKPREAQELLPPASARRAAESVAPSVEVPLVAGSRPRETQVEQPKGEEAASPPPSVKVADANIRAAEVPPEAKAVDPPPDAEKTPLAQRSPPNRTKSTPEARKPKAAENAQAQEARKPDVDTIKPEGSQPEPAIGPTARIALPAAPAPVASKPVKPAVNPPQPKVSTSPPAPTPTAKETPAETRAVQQLPDAPVPPRRGLQASVPKQPTSPPPDATIKTPGGDVANNNKGAAQAAALSQLGKIGGLGKSGAADGSANGSDTGIRGGQESFEARGSAIAQTCLNNAGAFLPVDNFTAVFPTRIDGATRIVTITGSPSVSRGAVAIATHGRIEQALSHCTEFQQFVLSQSSVREFNLKITSSSLTSGR